LEDPHSYMKLSRKRSLFVTSMRMSKQANLRKAVIVL